MRSDRELIDRYRAGDEDAFGEFYERHRRPLYALLLAYVRRRETAEELLQETFFAFLRGLDRLDGSVGLRPLLARTARNLAIDRLRRERCGERALAARAADPIFRPASGPPGAAVDEADRMGALLHGLPEEQREAVVLKALLGMTFREAAEVTGAPEATVASRYRYGIEKLRAALAPGGCG
jgi:RNA polymerase sigma factor (sigma-70 family)